MGGLRKTEHWYYRPWVVILMLFFVLGPFGLPLLFKSPSFGKKTKVFITLLTLLYTTYLIGGTVAAVRVVLSALKRYSF